MPPVIWWHLEASQDNIKPKQCIGIYTEVTAWHLIYILHACAGGPLSAAVATFNVTADSQGSIALKFSASKDQAILGGLEVYHAGGGPPPMAPQHARETAVPPAAAPSYMPPAHGADLQAAAPWPEPSGKP